MGNKININDAMISIDQDNIIIQRGKEFLSFSNLEGESGFKNIKSIINHKIGENTKIKPQNSMNYIQNLLNDKNILTPAEVIINSSSMSECAIITSNHISIITTVNLSDKSIDVEKSVDKFDKPVLESLNTILLVNKDLNHRTLIKLFITAIESKSSALWDLDVRNPVSGDLLAGTPKDSLIVACTGGKDKEDTEENVQLQLSVEKYVRKAVVQALKNSGFSKDIWNYIEDVDIKLEDLVDAGMELCVGVEKSEELTKKLENQILKSLEDINVISLVLAGIRLEEDYAKHRVHGVNVDDDPAYLYTDEVMGIAIANQIAGTKAIFNFKRYDEEKPGILGKLGPILDDVFAGIIAGCMSKIFEE